MRKRGKTRGIRNPYAAEAWDRKAGPVKDRRKRRELESVRKEIERELLDLQ